MDSLITGTYPKRRIIVEAWEVHIEQFSDTTACSRNKARPRIRRLTSLGLRQAITSCSILESLFSLISSNFICILHELYIK